MKKKQYMLLGGIALAVLATGASAAVIAPELAHEIASRHSGDRIPVIIQLADRANPRAFEVGDRRVRNNALLQALKDKAFKTQGQFSQQLAQLGASHTTQLWIINGISVTLPVWALDQLATHPAIGRIQYDMAVPFSASGKSPASTAGWNLNAIHAPEVWALGPRGNGVVVANMDTGVDPAHPDLAGKWRGGSNSWFDPYGQRVTPHDFSGHGTQTMGLMVGGDASGTAIGVVPDARWIAARIYNDAGQGTLSGIHQAFQWLMDPDGNPATIDAPDVVNASWGLAGGAPGSCNLEFNEDIQALTAAGIAVIFAAGNDGPAPGSGASPANNPASFSAGSIDQALAVENASSRGPSSCDGAVFPKLVAPGVNVVSSDLSFGGMPVYATVSGTSFAAPHVAGAMALLAGAFPAATVAELKSVLAETAQDFGIAGADNAFGYGAANVLAAHKQLAKTYGSASPPQITSSPSSTAVENQPYSYQVVATDPDGGVLTFSLDTAPAGMNISPASGLVSWTPTHNQLGANAVKVRVTDPTSRFVTQAYSISVSGTNNPPTAAADSYTVEAGKTLSMAVPGVLVNDTDPDGDAITAVLAGGPAHGTLTLNANGSFVYTPSAGYSGTDSFTYRDSDGKTTGNTATVTVTITAAAANKAPVAVNDTYVAPVRRQDPYSPQVFRVLANDTDSDGTIDPATVTIASPPSRGGTITVNGDGTLSYVPKLRNSASETFKYKVKDNRGAFSNTATVSVDLR
jgi:serine protease AprX